MADINRLECPARWPTSDSPAPDDKIRLAHTYHRPSRGGSGAGGPHTVEIFVKLLEFWETAKPDLEWVILAMVSGVVGNFTYDALKSFAKKSGEQLPDVAEGLNAHVVQAIALSAVRLRCSQLRLPEPPFPTFRVESCRRRREPAQRPTDPVAYWEVVIVGGVSDEFRARCSVLESDLSVYDIYLTITGDRRHWPLP